MYTFSSRYNTRRLILACTAAVALGLIGTSTARATAIAWTGGNGDATDPSNWSTQTWDGSQWIIDNASHQLPGLADIAYIDDPSGTATINGGSTNLEVARIGTYANGSLMINGGANVTINSAQVGQGANVGSLTVNGAGSSVVYSGTSLQVNNGTLNVLNGGQFTAQLITFSDPSTINVSGAGSKLLLYNGVPYSLDPTTSVNVTNGGSVQVNTPTTTGSRSSVIIDGSGSSWTGYLSAVGSYLQVSHGATLDTPTINVSGTQNSPDKARIFIIDQAQVRSGGINIGQTGSGTSAMVVNGRGTLVDIHSGWVNMDYNDGGSVLSISSGARVQAYSMSVGHSSAPTLAINLDQNSKLVFGQDIGSVQFTGKIRLTAGTRVAKGQYEPMEYRALDQSSYYYHGSLGVLGGKWNAGTHMVTVSYAKAAAAGDTVSIDLADTQRIRFIDAATGKRLGLAFAGSDASKILTVSASLITDPASSGLTSILASGDNGTYIDAWSIVPTTGYTQGEEAYLSIEVGENYDITAFKAWHYDGTDWTNYTPYDISYDGMYVGFTVTGFSSYALSGGPSMTASAVPEPASLGLMGIAAFGLMRRRRIVA